jgi:hypothetical protein
LGSRPLIVWLSSLAPDAVGFELPDGVDISFLDVGGPGALIAPGSVVERKDCASDGGGLRDCFYWAAVALGGTEGEFFPGGGVELPGHGR